MKAKRLHLLVFSTLALAAGAGLYTISQSGPVRAWQARRAVDAYVRDVKFEAQPSTSFLPAYPPQNFIITFSRNEGMSGESNKILVSFATSTYIHTYFDASNEVVERAYNLAMTKDQVVNVYHIFRTLGFDQIKTHLNTEEIYDGATVSLMVEYSDPAGTRQTSRITLGAGGDRIDEKDLPTWRSLVGLFEQIIAVYPRPN